MTLKLDPTADDIRVHMADHGVGLIEAKRHLTRAYLIDALRRTDQLTVDDLRGIVLRMAKMMVLQ